MAAHRMAVRYRPPRHFGELLHVHARRKERGTDVICIEDAKDLEPRAFVGAVVEGKADMRSRAGHLTENLDRRILATDHRGHLFLHSRGPRWVEASPSRPTRTGLDQPPTALALRVPATTSSRLRPRSPRSTVAAFRPGAPVM